MQLFFLFFCFYFYFFQNEITHGLNFLVLEQQGAIKLKQHKKGIVQFFNSGRFTLTMTAQKGIFDFQQHFVSEAHITFRILIKVLRWKLCCDFFKSFNFLHLLQNMYFTFRFLIKIKIFSATQTEFTVCSVGSRFEKFFVNTWLIKKALQQCCFIVFLIQGLWVFATFNFDRLFDVASLKFLCTMRIDWNLFSVRKYFSFCLIWVLNSR